MKIIVTLHPDQLEQAAVAGALRQASAFSNRRSQHKQVMFDDKPYWEESVLSAIAEYAVCLVYGFDFSGYVPHGISRLHDAGPLEVRTVRRQGYALMAYPKDVDHQQLVLTRVKENRVLLEGWATAGEIRQWGYLVMDRWPGLQADDLHDMHSIGYTPVPSSQWREYRPRLDA